MFTLENTTGYTQSEIDALNIELEKVIEDFEKENPLCFWWEIEEIEKDFHDEVAKR